MRALNLKQLAFARVLRARAIAKNDPMQAEAYAVGRGAAWRDTPETLECLNLKAAVTALNTGETLAVERDLAGEFLQLVRARSVVGRLADLRRVPLNTSMLTAAGSPTASWVGEGRAAPMSRGSFARAALQPFKLRVDSVVTSELLHSATAAADALFAHEMARALATAEDRYFLDPLFPAVTDVKPASITSGLTATVSAGTSAANILADLENIFDTFDGADGSLDSAVLALHPKSARSLAKLQGANGGLLFPNIGVRGGTVWGAPCLVSSALEHGGSPGERFAVLVDPERVLYAEEPELKLESSQNAAVQMDDAPVNTAAAQVSLWQNNLVALRVIRMVSWQTAGTAAAVLTGMAW